jgi:alkylhydroperoxidase/carboxymuconolactone decarboxylase family protein YurZ
MLRGFHPDLHDFVLESAYGRVLSRPGLPPAERELLAVGSLAAMEQIPQMIAHARGARRFGASREAVQEAMFTAFGDATRVAEHMQRVR